MLKLSNYIDFQEEDFVFDEDFQDWVWGRCNEEENQFWIRFQQNYPLKDNAIKQAAEVLKKIPFEGNLKGEIPSDEKIQLAYEETKRRLAAQEEIKSDRSIISLKRIWWAAAAIIAVMVVGGYFFLDVRNSNTDLVNVPSNDIQPGGNKAILTLSDGSQIVLDNAETGAISTQGNVTVIKLSDGELSYKEGVSLNNKYEVTYNTITTPRGGQYQLILQDGTKVWLNAESSLRYPTAFNGESRRVEMTGEGYFEVFKNEKMPFYVSVDNMEVRVLGTHFNINSYSDEADIKTTLLEGKVEVTEKEGKAVVLKPGEQAKLLKSQKKLITTNKVDIDEVMAWKNGLFLFNGADIKTILRNAARWYDAEIVYTGEVNETFSGGLQRSEDVSQLLKILEATDKVRFIINKKQIMVQPK